MTKPCPRCHPSLKHFHADGSKCPNGVMKLPKLSVQVTKVQLKKALAKSYGFMCNNKEDFENFCKELGFE